MCSQYYGVLAGLHQLVGEKIFIEMQLKVCVWGSLRALTKIVWAFSSGGHLHLTKWGRSKSRWQCCSGAFLFYSRHYIRKGRKSWVCPKKRAGIRSHFFIQYLSKELRLSSFHVCCAKILWMGTRLKVVKNVTFRSGQTLINFIHMLFEKEACWLDIRWKWYDWWT